MPFNGWLVLHSEKAQVPYQAEINFSPESGTFTIEGWIKNPHLSYVIFKKSSFALNFSTTFYPAPIPGINTNYVTFMNCGYLCSGVSVVLSSCSGFNSCIPNGWFHFAYVYDQVSAAGTLFWNGNNLGGASLSSSTEPIELSGADGIDEIRISNSARYSDSFTPESAPFGCDANTKALWNFDEITGSTTFLNACGTVDNLFSASGGAQSEGEIGYTILLPAID